MFGLFAPKASLDDRVAALIRDQSILTAARCCQLSQGNNKTQFLASMREFMAFYATIAVNEISIRNSTTATKESPGTIFQRLFKAICAGKLVKSDWKLIQTAILCDVKSKFDSFFYAYWNADLVALRITPKDLVNLESKGTMSPPDDEPGRAFFAVLVRTCRLDNEEGLIPPTILVALFDQVIRQEASDYLQKLKKILK